MLTTAKGIISTPNPWSKGGTARRATLLTLLSASLLSAQPAPKFEIRVTVVDSATNQPLSGIPISISNYGTPTAAAPQDQQFTNKQVTDSGGVVTYAPPIAARLLISVPPTPGFDLNSLVQELTVDAPTASVRVPLLRLAVVSGRVIDSETRQPVARAVARLVHLSRKPGIGWALPETTYAQGRFSINLPPLEVPVAVRIEPSIWTPSLHYLMKFSAEDAEQTDEDYESVLPLGGDKKSNALPLTTPSGLTIDVPLRKITYRRVALRFDGTCAQNETFDLSLSRDGEADLAVQKIACGDILLRGMLPGSTYHIALTPPYDSPPQTQRRAEADFTVGDRNFEVRMAFVARIDLRGRVLLAEGSAPWPKDLKVRLNGSDVPAAKPDAEGRFVLPQALLGARQPMLTALGTAHVIQRVEFRGKRLPVLGTSKLDWRGDGELLITLDDRLGSLTGEVSDGSRASDGDVVLASWPLPDGINAGEGYTVFPTTAGGRYNGQRIPAGEYRVFAMPRGMQTRLAVPGVLERAAGRGEKLIVERGASATLNLRVTDPTR